MTKKYKVKIKFLGYDNVITYKIKSENVFILIFPNSINAFLLFRRFLQKY